MLILEDGATLHIVLLDLEKLRAFTFNGGGTVDISDFYVKDYGILVRSCGKCKDNGGVLCGINTNYGGTCTMSNACEDSGKNCDLFEGDFGASEPSRISSGWQFLQG
ncbi:pectate lyase [Fusarium pseudoanthophilum]|uniref:Pectate lyase n=1 Tax=Fusarium pseudoanthophilum TaxID=48495 RepID=A0A8H5NWJ9_9HYPO|nr:pectate lyase [Fusarium pseudoanthophilum]